MGMPERLADMAKRNSVDLEVSRNLTTPSKVVVANTSTVMVVQEVLDSVETVDQQQEYLELKVPEALMM